MSTTTDHGARTLTLSGPVSLQAAQQGEPPRRVRVLAYTGKEIQVSGLGRVVLDLEGLRLPESLPLLHGHGNDLANVLGHGVPRIEAHAVLVEGTLTETEAGERVRALALQGVPLQASVGVEIEARQAIPAGGRVLANGREFKAGSKGMILVKAGRLREVSIMPLGADDGTSVTLAARMDAAREDQAALEDEGQAADQVITERERVRAILAETRDYPHLQAQAIEEGWTVDRTRLACLDSLRQGRAQAFIPQARRGLAARPRDVVAASALLMADQEQVALRAFGERTIATLERPSGWPELCAIALRAEGRDVPRDRGEMLRAAFSTSNLPGALGTAVEKITLDAFVENSTNWLAIGRQVDAADFKEGKAIRLSAGSGFEKVGKDGEIKHGLLGEDAFPFRVETYARMFGITRQDIINDDAGLLTDIPMLLGAEGARSVSDAFFAVLVGEAGTYFSSEHDNLLTSGSALDLDSLALAVQRLRTQADGDGRIIGFTPFSLLVPAALEQTARQLINSTLVDRNTSSADNLPTGNPFKGLDLTLLVEPRLDATSETAWYLFAAPRHGPLLVAFLRGVRTPKVEQADQPFNMLGLQFRAYLDFGVSLGEYRAAVKATGAA